MKRLQISPACWAAGSAFILLMACACVLASGWPWIRDSRQSQDKSHAAGTVHAENAPAGNVPGQNASAAVSSTAPAARRNGRFETDVLSPAAIASAFYGSEKNESRPLPIRPEVPVPAVEKAEPAEWLHRFGAFEDSAGQLWLFIRNDRTGEVIKTAALKPPSDESSENDGILVRIDGRLYAVKGR